MKACPSNRLKMCVLESEPRRHVQTPCSFALVSGFKLAELIFHFIVAATFSSSLFCMVGCGFVCTNCRLQSLLLDHPQGQAAEEVGRLPYYERMWDDHDLCCDCGSGGVCDLGLGLYHGCGPCRDDLYPFLSRSLCDPYYDPFHCCRTTKGFLCDSLAVPAKWAASGFPRMSFSFAPVLRFANF